ncbi:MAG: hypothetical protein NVS9B14_00450 [Candidatus Acidiferrum sp.]
MAPQRAIKKVADFTNASVHVCTDGDRPKDTVLAKRDFLLLSNGFKAGESAIRRASKEEQFIEVSLASQFSLLIWQASILSEFLGPERTERHDFET